MADARPAPERGVVERAALSLWAPIALTCGTRVDQTRIDRTHVLGVQAQPFAAVGQEIRHEHVGRREQLVEH